MLAEKAVADGKGHYYGDADSEIKLAKKMPKSNKEAKLIRSDAISFARSKKSSAKIIDKYFSFEPLKEPDMSGLEELQSTENKKFTQIFADKRRASQLLKRQSLYNRAIKPYIDSEKLIQTAHDYTYLDEIEEKYHALSASAEN